MGPSGPAFPRRVGKVVFSHFEDWPKLDLRVVLSSPGLDFGRVFGTRFSFKIEFENH